jgi:hypothetical protein
MDWNVFSRLYRPNRRSSGGVMEVRRSGQNWCDMDFDRSCDRDRNWHYDLSIKQWRQGKYRNRPEVKNVLPAATLLLCLMIVIYSVSLMIIKSIPLTQKSPLRVAPVHAHDCHYKLRLHASDFVSLTLGGSKKGEYSFLTLEASNSYGIASSDENPESNWMLVLD